MSEIDRHEQDRTYLDRAGDRETQGNVDADSFTGSGDLLDFGQVQWSERTDTPADPPAGTSVMWVDGDTDQLKIKITNGGGNTRTYCLSDSNTYGAFGDLLTAELDPVVNVAFHYNINTRQCTTFTTGSGTITQTSDMARLSTTAATSSSARLETTKHLHYNPGQALVARYGCLFTTGAANSHQEAGLGNPEDAFAFGYNGTAFGVLHRTGGQKKIEKFTVTNGATTAGGTVTLTLDGTAQAIEVTNGNDSTEIAEEIADGGTGSVDWSGVGNGWEAKVIGQTVYFISFDAGVHGGSYSFADTDTTGVAVTVANGVTGAASTDTWTAQASWNVDVMDGTGASGMTLDPTKGNVYQIAFQSGFGDIEYYIEDSETGRFVLVHRNKYSNANTTPSVSNPTLPLYAETTNTTNNTAMVIDAVCFGGFIAGPQQPDNLLTSIVAENTSIGTTEEPIVTVANHIIYQSKENRAAVRLNAVLLANESSSGSKNLIVRVRVDSDISGGSSEPSFSDVNANTSVLTVDTSSDSVTGGQVLAAPVLGDAGQLRVDVQNLDLQMQPGQKLTVTGEASGGTNIGTVSLQWSENQ